MNRLLSIVRNLVHDRPLLVSITTYLVLNTWFVPAWAWWIHLGITGVMFVGIAMLERYIATHHPTCHVVDELSPDFCPVLVEVVESLEMGSALFAPTTHDIAGDRHFGKLDIEQWIDGHDLFNPTHQIVMGIALSVAL